MSKHSLTVDTRPQYTTHCTEHQNLDTSQITEHSRNESKFYSDRSTNVAPSPKHVVVTAAGAAVGGHACLPPLVAQQLKQDYNVVRTLG